MALISAKAGRMYLSKGVWSKIVNIAILIQKQKNMLFLCLLCILATRVQNVRAYEYKARYFEQPVDHFGFGMTDTFQQRYLISSEFWNTTSSPIFLYVGNEGDIELFANNTGFMWEIAPEFGAMVVFSEHRFYGKSLPYPAKERKLGFLSSEQALADHANLVMHLKKTIPGASNSPVIGFGGSYGGMLASWMRIKYPHILDGALAASAPVIQFTGMGPCDAYAKSVTKAYKWGGDECPNVIRKGFSLIDNLGKTEEGISKLTKIFKLCNPLNTSGDLIDWVRKGLSSVAMVNYPYPNSFLGSLPAWPVKKMCSFLTDPTASDIEILSGVFSALSVFYNYSSSQPSCIDLDISPIDVQLGDNWHYQACTEMIMPMCQTGVNDMFLPEPWNLTSYGVECAKTYGVKTKPFMAELMYGGPKLQAASNIIFSNGDIDPWNGGGIHEDINPTVIALKIKDGAHHLDLRKSDKLDPPSVTLARETEKKWIRIWIKQAKANQI